MSKHNFLGGRYSMPFTSPPCPPPTASTSPSPARTSADLHHHRQKERDQNLWLQLLCFKRTTGFIPTQVSSSSKRKTLKQTKLLISSAKMHQRSKASFWFPGRWPFGRSAGRFTAPIAQSGLFWGQKCCFSAGNSFFRDIIQKNCSHCDGTPKRQQFCVDSLHGGPLGGRQGPFLAQN